MKTYHKNPEALSLLTPDSTGSRSKDGTERPFQNEYWDNKEPGCMSKCPNCSAELTQEYCSNCGQRRIRPDDLSARRFFRELFDEVANLEKKFRPCERCAVWRYLAG